jgi:para-nitrobenzyl esterase
MSLLIVDQDHYNPFVGHAPGRFTFTRQQVGTRYMAAIVRTLADPNDPADMKAANAAQDRITVQQASRGSFEVPAWDQASLAKVREALATLGTLQGRDPGVRFGKKGEVDPVSHLIGTATGWGGNPAEAAVYVGGFPAANDGRTVHRVTVKDVPVDGFWSLSVYDATGYFAKNDLGVYSVNNLTAKPNPDGSVTVQFGGCGKGVANCIPITPGWSYVTRLYRPRAAVLDGTWVFPEPKPAG